MDTQAPGLEFAERHYTVADIAKLWELSADFVQRLFVTESGVLVLGGESKPSTRRYRTLRIPESVVARVHKRLTNKGRN